MGDPGLLRRSALQWLRLPPPARRRGARAKGHRTSRNGTRSYVTLLLRRSQQAYASDAGPHLAGSIAFRVLFSLFPLAIVLTGLFGIVVQLTGVQADVVDAIVSNAPLSEQGARDLTRLLEGATGNLSGLGLLAAVGLVWSASGVMSTIRYGLNRAWDVDSPRPLVRGKALDVGLVFATSLLVLLSMSIAIGARLVRHHAGSAPVVGEALSGAATWTAGLVGSFALAFVTVLVLYRVVPARTPRFSQLWPAAALVALTFALLQNVFAVYVEHFSNYNAVYGSLGGVVALLFFVYLSASAFLFGAELAAHAHSVREEIARVRDESARGSRS